MGNMDDVMHRKDEQERHAELEAWLTDAAAIQQVFAAARVDYLSIEPEAHYFVVTVPPQVNIQQRCERLDVAAGDDWTVTYSVRVWEGRHVYVVRRRG